MNFCTNAHFSAVYLPELSFDDSSTFLKKKCCTLFFCFVSISASFSFEISEKNFVKENRSRLAIHIRYNMKITIDNPFTSLNGLLIEGSFDSLFFFLNAKLIFLNFLDGIKQICSNILQKKTKISRKFLNWPGLSGNSSRPAKVLW